MNLKTILQKLLLGFINLLYYPFVLGYWSENNGGEYVITNKEATKIRSLGYSKWQTWTNNPDYSRPYNEYVEIVKSIDFSLKTLWHLFQKDTKIQSSLFFISTFLWLESIDLTLRLTTILFAWPTDKLNPYYIHLSATLFVTTIFTLSDTLIKYVANRKSKEQK